MDMTKMLHEIMATIRAEKGFTLIEMLIALAITGIMMSAVYGVYISSIHNAKSEEHRVDLQQGQRFAIDLLASQLRHAGYDRAESLFPTIRAAGEDFIYFTADFAGCVENTGPPTCTKSATGQFPDGDINDPGEHIVFCRYVDNNGDTQLGFINGDGDEADDGTPDFIIGNIDTNNDGIADAGHSHGASTHQPVITIEELEFYYTLSSGGPTIYPADPSTIRSVQISLLARTEKEDKQYKQSGGATFAPASGAGPWTGYTDGFRRRLMIANVRFRNMGL